jgi:hypothetical protein
VGIRLIVEVMDHAPSTLTHREAWVLAVLAEDANDETRITWSSVEAPSILHRARVSRPQMYEVLKKLTAKGAVSKVTSGQKNVRAAEYKILPMGSQCPENPDTDGTSQCPENADTDGSQCPGFPDTDQPQCQQKPDTDPTPQRPQIPDTDQPQCPENPDTDGSQCPQIPDTYPSLQEIDISLPPRASRAPAASDEAFNNFWAAYPRKVGKGAARTAWAKALKRGADPAAIAAAVPKHAAYWRALGTELRFIPYPATWLNSERFDDQLDTPAPTPQQPRQQTYEERGIF